MDVSKALPIATRREWSYHRSHDLSAGQVILRIFITIVIAYLLCGMVVESVSASRRLHDTLPPLSDPAWQYVTASQWFYMAATSLVWLAILIIFTIFFIRAITRAATAIAINVRVTKLSICERVNNGFQGAGEQPGDQITAVGTLAIYVLAFMALTVFGVWMVYLMWAMCPRPLLPFGVLVISTLAFSFIRGVVAEQFDPERLAYAVATLIPLYRGRSMQVKAPSACLVCSGQRRDRPRAIRMWKELKAWCRRWVSQLAERSAWIAFFWHHSTLTSALFFGILALVILEFAGNTLRSSVVIISLIVAAGIFITEMRGENKTILDAMLGDPSWRSIVNNIVWIIVAFALVCGVNRLAYLVAALKKPMEHVFGGYDEDIAMLFFITLTTCLIYILYSYFRTRYKGPPRWSPKEAARGSIIPLAGLAVVAVQGGWSVTMIIAVIGWLAAYSASERKAWSTVKHGDFQKAAPSD
ncbi:MAG: hypothetical protein LBK42_03585 [Propionibacteriaceae bacterium]|jgi:hypothetical protein|nr:hypothetical protein [Propionibacteriaceae bacterium]